MNKRIKTKDKPQTEIGKLRQVVDDLQLERLESLRQLRLGAVSDVRKPTRLRRQIARELTRLRQLETAQATDGNDLVTIDNGVSKKAVDSDRKGD